MYLVPQMRCMVLGLLADLMLLWRLQMLVGEQERAPGDADSHEGGRLVARYATV
jgi:hypothetical protein